MVKEKAYVPGDWAGVSESKVVRLDDVLEAIEKLKDFAFSSFSFPKICKKSESNFDKICD